jgi:hypothetical protein
MTRPRSPSPEHALSSMTRVLALTIVLCSSILAATPPVASAGTYDVQFCATSSEEGLTFEPPAGGFVNGFLNTDGCATPAASIEQATVPSSGLVGTLKWTVTVPNPGLHITLLSAHASFKGPWMTPVTWQLLDGNGVQLDSYLGNANGNTPPPDSRQIVARVPSDGGAPSITSQLTCSKSAGCVTSDLGVTFTNLIARVADNAAPTILNPGGLLTPSGEVSGTQEVTFAATDDPGSGVARTAVLIDGAEYASSTDGNSLRCAVPYRHFVPCARALDGSYEVATTQLADGTHTVQAEAFDAAENDNKSAAVSFVVHNAPGSIAPPAIDGIAKLGSRLTAAPGTWARNPTAFAHQWLRCPASVTSVAGAQSCTPIPDATSKQYTLTSADIYGRVLVKVTASNASVTHTDAFSAPTGLIADANGRTTPPSGDSGGGGGGGVIDRTPPALSAVSLTSTRFAVARARTAIAALVRGTTLRLTSSEGGRLSIAVASVRPGQRRGRACRVVRRRVRRGACRVVVPVATLTRTIGAGGSSIAFSGRIDTKALAPGAYQLVLTVRDGAANVSRAVTRSFTVVRGAA